jgi:hypothetical protein
MFESTRQHPLILVPSEIVGWGACPIYFHRKYQLPISLKSPIKTAENQITCLFLLYLAAALFIMSLIQSPGFINDRAGVIAMTDFSRTNRLVSAATVLIRG